MMQCASLPIGVFQFMPWYSERYGIALRRRASVIEALNPLVEHWIETIRTH